MKKKEKYVSSKILVLVSSEIRSEIFEETYFLSISLFQCKKQIKTSTEIF